MLTELCIAAIVKVSIASQTAVVTCESGGTKTLKVITGNPSAKRMIDRTPVGTYKVSSVFPIDDNEGYYSGGAIFKYANDASKNKPPSFYAAHGMVPNGGRWSIGCIRGNWLQNGIHFKVGTIFKIS